MNAIDSLKVTVRCKRLDVALTYFEYLSNSEKYDN